MQITSVTNENIHEVVPKYIDDNDIQINNIDDIINTYVDMVKDKYLFLIEGDLLKDILVNITYMYSPNDDMNKDRVICHLTGDESDSDDSDNDSPIHKNQKNAGTQFHKDDKKDDKKDDNKDEDNEQDKED